MMFIRISIVQTYLRIWRRVRQLPAYPLMIAAFPTLSLYAENMDQIAMSDIVRSLIISIMLTTVTYAILGLFFRDARKAAIGASLLIVVFFSYGHTYSVVKSFSLMGVVVGRHRYLSVVWLMALIAGLAYLKRRHTITRLNSAVGIGAMVAVILPLATILASYSEITLPRRPVPSQMLDSQRVTINLDSSELPDIYYIVPDSYARADILASEYGFDGFDFVQSLAAEGFYVAAQSKANYPWTHQSLTSSLNMEYLDPLLGGERPGRRIDVEAHIKHNRVRMLLEGIGYKTIGFVTGWTGSEIFDAHIILAPDMSNLDALRMKGLMNEFESMLLHQTVIRILLDFDQAGRILATGFIRERAKLHFDVQSESILGIFENLQEVPRINGPKFIFAHILSPHSPYLFDADGNRVDSRGPFTLSPQEDLPVELERQLYRDQVIFISRKLEETVRVIRERSERPVVIIIQADHGFGVDLDWENVRLPALEARMSILNAYLLSDECRESLYPSISPVNSFRYVLSCELGFDIPLLEDVSYIGYERFTPLNQAIEQLGLGN